MLMNITLEQLQNIIEAALLVAGRPLKIADIQKLFDEHEQPSVQEVRLAISTLSERYATSGIELTEVASGFQFQAKTELSPWLSRLWEERAPRYSRAFLETLALIAYRQPITRAEIEEIRGVTVSSNIIKTLSEREWIRVIGYKDAPGKPAIYGTTKTFLDHFNLKTLDELPTLAELKDLDGQEARLQVELELSHSEANTNTPVPDTTETAEDAINEISEEIAEEIADELADKMAKELTEEIAEEISYEIADEAASHTETTTDMDIDSEGISAEVPEPHNE